MASHLSRKSPMRELPSVSQHTVDRNHSGPGAEPSRPPKNMPGPATGWIFFPSSVPADIQEILRDASSRIHVSPKARGLSAVTRAIIDSCTGFFLLSFLFHTKLARGVLIRAALLAIGRLCRQVGEAIRAGIGPVYRW